MDRVARAGQFFQHSGRELDRARFAYHFENGSREQLLEALGRYQNADGGFGHALEVDIKAPDSNPFATVLALTICRQADAPRDHLLLRDTVAYLERTQDEDGGWRLSPAIYQHELAPWFQAWQWPSFSPAGALAGLLRELGLGSEQLHTRVAGLFERLAKPEDLAGDEFYNVWPYAGYFLAEQSHPQQEIYRDGVLWWLIRQHVAGTIEDSGHFFEYVLTPQTYTGRLLPTHILHTRLDMLAAEQADDGGWPTPYNTDWRGLVTVQNLLVLRAFGRI
jgi:hypothetical protein